MNYSEEINTGNDDLDRLLRAAGPRFRPPEDLEREVRDAVHREWRTVVAARTRRRRFAQVAIAAGLGAVALTVWLLNQAPTQAEVVASIERSVDGGSVRSEDPATERPLAEEQVLHAGDTLSTGASGGVLLRLSDGISIRLDRNSVVRFASRDDVALSAGALYVDAGIESDAQGGLRVQTPAGVVRHVGTQYEVRLVDLGTRIRVREGRVQFSAPGGARVVGEAGTQLTILADGEAHSEAIARSGADWTWIGKVAPRFTIENRTLPEFLQWASREIGQEVVYATPASREEAAGIRLRGSIEGLTPDAALAAVLSTTRLTSVEKNGKILIDLPAMAN
jgi:ferric-dicitrate binding protein FerR (iron transport regulator)